MIEGLQLLISEHPTLTFFLIIFLAYVNFIIVKLVWQRRVVPIYNRPFPWTWNLVIDSLKTDAQNLKIVADEIFPWWKELILGCAVISLFLITCFVYVNGVVLLSSLPKSVLVHWIIFNHIFG